MKSVSKTLAVLVALSATTLSTAQAASDSGCYTVANVGRGDALNLRSGPSTRNRVVDRLVPGRHGVLSRTGRCVPRRLPRRSRWCPLTHFSGNGTTTGWAKARYLRRSGCP